MDNILNDSYIFKSSLNNYEDEIKRQESISKSRSQQSSDENQLMVPSISNIEIILEQLQSNKEWMINAILKKNIFIDQLFQIFDDLEDFSSESDLQKIYEIVKILIFSCDSSMISLLVSDENFIKTVATLEYEPQNNGEHKKQYRQFIEEKQKFKTVFSINDKHIITKIHTNFRINYIKDSVLAYFMDDHLNSTLNTIVYYNNIDIINHVISDDNIIGQYIQNFESHVIDSIGFLEELLAILKTVMQPQLKKQVIEKFYNHDIFHKLTYSLQYLLDRSPNQLNITRTIECFSQLSFQNPEYLSQFIYQYPKESVNLANQILRIYSLNEIGIHIQITELFKYLMDNTNENKMHVQDYIFPHILKPMLNNCKNYFDTIQNIGSFTQQIIDLLTFMVKNYTLRTRLFIINNKAIQNIQKALQIKKKNIELNQIKFMSQLVYIKDEQLLKYICSNDLLDPIIEIFFKYAKKYNILSSACLELFRFVQVENIKKIIKLLNLKYKSRIVEYKIEPLFKKIFEKYEQYNINEDQAQEKQLEQEGHKIQDLLIAQKPIDFQKQLESEEEDSYFSHDDSESYKHKTQNEDLLVKGRLNLQNLQNKIHQKNIQEQDTDFFQKKNQNFNSPFIKKIEPKSSLNFKLIFETNIDNNNIEQQENHEKIQKKVKLNPFL